MRPSLTQLCAPTGIVASRMAKANSGASVEMPVPLISFPAHALPILEERLREQEAEGVEMPERMERDELALRILIVAALPEVEGRPRG
jgi:hypothetical protein